MPRMAEPNKICWMKSTWGKKTQRSSGPVGRTAVSVANQMKRTVAVMRTTDWGNRKVGPTSPLEIWIRTLALVGVGHPCSPARVPEILPKNGRFDT
jgi:hypothetical protein